MLVPMDIHAEHEELRTTRTRFLSESDLFQISLYAKLTEAASNPREALADIINEKIRDLQVALYAGNDTDLKRSCANVEAVCGEMRRVLDAMI